MLHEDDKTEPEPPGSSIKGKTLLLLNTGPLSKRFILERIKQLGITTVVLNSTKNWARPFADHWILADTYNHKACISALRSFLVKNPDVKIHGATTFWEDDIQLLAKICREFNFIGNSEEAAQNTRSKFFMHEVLRTKGRPFISQVLLNDSRDVEKAIQSVGLPAVIKPKYGSDSEFVVYVKDADSARETYQYVRQNCTPKFNPIYNYNKHKFVFQEFIDGPEFSVECFVQNGTPHVIGINEKTTMQLPFFMETGDYCPARIASVKKEQLVKEVKAALVAMGVQNSLAHVEIKLTKQGPKIIEVGSRMGGVYVYQNIKMAYGFDLIQTACQIACGIEVKERPTKLHKYALAKFFIPQESGVISSLKGLDELQNHEHVVDFFWWKKLGDAIRVPPDGYESLGWVLTVGNSYAEAERKMHYIMQGVKIELEPFDKIAIRQGERPLIRCVTLQMLS